MVTLLLRRSAASSKPSRKQKILTCPQCGGHDLYYENALITGFKYHCKACDYIGALVIEQEVELDGEGQALGIEDRAFSDKQESDTGGDKSAP